MSSSISAATLGRVRLVVQILSFLFLVYGGLLVGHYSAEKISGSLPALSCAYDQLNGGYCVLIPTQHQLHHRVGEALVQMQQFSYKVIIPLLFTFLSFYVFFVFLNKMFCGWICPLGTFQEMMYKMSHFFGLQKNHSLSVNQLRFIRPIKWLMLAILVFILPLVAGLGVAPHAAGDAFCQVCPSRVLTTLASGNFEQLTISTAGVADIIFSSIRALLFGSIVVLSMTMRQPFCRICPLLAFNALFQKLSPMRLVKKSMRSVKSVASAPKPARWIFRKSGKSQDQKPFMMIARYAVDVPNSVLMIMSFKSSLARLHYSAQAESTTRNASNRKSLKV